MLDWFCMRALLQLSAITKAQSAGCEKRLPSPHSSWGRMNTPHLPTRSLRAANTQTPDPHCGSAAAPAPCAGRPRAVPPPGEMAWEGTGGNVLFSINVYKQLLEGHKLSQTHLISLPGQHSASSDLMQSHFAIQQCRILGKKGWRYNLLLCGQVKVPECEEAPK